MSNDRETLLEFPCRFPIKAFGKESDIFEDTVFALVKPHVPDLERSDLSWRKSSGGRYIAVTVHMTARSQAQLDAIYTDLSSSDDVIMSL